MKSFFSIRWTFTYVWVLTVCLLMGAGYIQYRLGLQPCPLCQLQRMVLGCIGLIAFFAMVHNPKKAGTQYYSFSIILLSLIGVGLTSRQIFIQNHPPADLNTACGASLDYILQTVPILDAIRFILTGHGSCAEIEWRFLSLSLTQWTLYAFILLIVIAMKLVQRARRQ